MSVRKANGVCGTAAPGRCHYHRRSRSSGAQSVEGGLSGNSTLGRRDRHARQT